MDNMKKMKIRRNTLILIVILALTARACWERVQHISVPFWSAQVAENTKLRARIQKRHSDLHSLETATERVNKARHRSLPGDIPVAVAIYQSMLVKVADRAQLRNCTIRPGTAVEEDGVGARIPFTIHGAGGEMQIGNFISLVESLPLLQRVTSLTIAPIERDAASELSLDVAVEAFALFDAERISPSAFGDDGAFSLDMEPPTGEIVDVLSLRKPFSRTESASALTVPEDKGQSSLEAETAPAPAVRLVGIWSMGDRSEAWFANGQDGQTQIVSSQFPLVLGNSRALIVAIHSDGVVVEVNGKLQRLTLGESPRMASAQ